ncbi:hypothetical protein, partial [Halarcobacter sp.]|uniref:hypothetical protein n=1 Tax=Halarcobacter sp. TaxID=2321133 RepID=UPI003A942EBC
MATINIFYIEDDYPDFTILKKLEDNFNVNVFPKDNFIGTNTLENFYKINFFEDGFTLGNN